LSDALRKRFGETAELVAQQQDRRTEATQERLRRLLTLTGEERALDIGPGVFALALAPLVREVIGVDIVPGLVEEGRKRAPANVELVDADATGLPTGPARSTSSARHARCTTSRGPSSCSPK
jgi:ubiquinone/menaquinone biosynthesis C-methylase UbiE